MAYNTNFKPGIQVHVNDVRVENIELLANDYVSMDDLKQNITNNKVLSPLEFLIAVYSSETVNIHHRVEAAKAATKFVHKPQPIALVNESVEGRDMKIINLQEAAKIKLLNYLNKDEITGSSSESDENNADFINA